MDAAEGVLGAHGGLVGVFDQRDADVSPAVPDTAQLLRHRQEVGGHLAGVHEQHGSRRFHTERESTVSGGERACAEWVDDV